MGNKLTAEFGGQAAINTIAAQNSEVPKHLYALLDFTTAALFLRYGRMRTFVVKSYEAKIQHIGDLVQMDEAEVFKRLPTSKANQELIREELEASGLHFSMRAPGWVKPVTFVKAHLPEPSAS